MRTVGSSPSPGSGGHATDGSDRSDARSGGDTADGSDSSDARGPTARSDGGARACGEEGSRRACETSDRYDATGRRRLRAGRVYSDRWLGCWKSGPLANEARLGRPNCSHETRLIRAVCGWIVGRVSLVLPSESARCDRLGGNSAWPVEHLRSAGGVRPAVSRACSSHSRHAHAEIFCRTQNNRVASGL